MENLEYEISAFFFTAPTIPFKSIVNASRITPKTRNVKSVKIVTPSSYAALFYLTTEESFCHCDCKHRGLLVISDSFIMINSPVPECTTL